jgi:hypothetical protein
MRGIALFHSQGETFVFPVVIDQAESPFFVNIEMKFVLLPF